jgi:U32 family peptidase
VAAGADAVYLGGKQFGARKFAGNFDENELDNAISYAHLRGVRVYITVNTLIHDRELAGLSEYLIRLYETGVDAILIQDTGVAALAQELVPELPLHASTQMTVYDRDGVEMASRQGFSRVVLAREVSLDEITAITRDPACAGTGIEIFVHGALCYGYSGQCLLSSMIGGRSGNRGTCAQPCRKPYHFVAGSADQYGRPRSLERLPFRDRYLLSTRDLSLYPQLGRLADSGIVALKIEGRMRSPSYVAIVVSIYRKALDAIARGAWSPVPGDEQDLALAFNRGFTTGYLSGASPVDVMGRDRPDNRGLFIGTIESCSPAAGTCGVRLSGPISPEPGDGIVVIDSHTGREDGMVLSRAPHATGGQILIPVHGRFPRGSAVYITRRAELVRRAETVCSGERKTGFLPVDIRFRVPPDHVPVIDCVTQGKDGITCSITWRSDAPLPPALTAPLTDAVIEAQLKKSGDSVFFVRHCIIDYPGGLFAPISLLNRMRRAALLATEEAVIRSWIPGPAFVAGARARLNALSHEDEPVLASACQPPYSGEGPAIAVYVDSVDGAREALRNGCRIVCFEPDEWSLPGHGPGSGDFPACDPAAFIVLMEEYARICHECGATPVWKWPPITRGGFRARALSRIQPVFAAGVEEILLDTPGSAGAVRRVEPRMRLSGGTGLNVFNHRSVQARSPPFHRLTLSPELTSGEIRELLARLRGSCSPQVACMVQGNLEVMVSEDDLPGCIREHIRGEDRDLFVGIMDERERIFPVRRDPSGHTCIRNAVETCLIDHLPTLIQAGIGTITIDARGRGAHYAGEMTSIYREAIRAFRENSWNEGIGGWKERIRDRALGGITAGAFVRGLKEDVPAVSDE